MSAERERRPVWWAAAGALACLALASAAFFEPSFALFLRLLIGRFVYSTSNAGVLFVFVMLCIALMAQIVPASSRGASEVQVQGGRPLSLLLMSLGLGHLAHAIALVVWSQDVGILARTRHYAWVAGEQSFTTLTHSHLGKTGLAHIFSLAGLTEKNHLYDVGGPLKSFVSLPFSIIITASLVASLLLLVVGLRTIRERNGDDPCLSLAYLIAGLSCIQLIMDGGPFALRMGPSLIVLCVIVLKPFEIGWEAWIRRVTPTASTFLALHLMVGCVLSGRPAISALLSVAPQAAGFILLIGMVRTNSVTRNYFARGAVRGCAIAVFAVGLMLDFSTEVLPLLQPLTDSDRVHIVDLADGSIREQLDHTKARTPLELYSAHGDPHKPRTVLISRSGSSPGEQGALFALTQISEPPPSTVIDGQSIFVVEDVYPLREDLPGWILKIRAAHLGLPPAGGRGGNVLDRNNRYVWLRILDASLRRSQIDRYVVVPIDQSPNANTAEQEQTRKSYRHRDPGAEDSIRQG